MTAPSPGQPSLFGSGGGGNGNGSGSGDGNGSGNGNDGDSNPIMSVVTPAPQRHHPRLAPPSTSQLPSSYLPTSSPAPFWKYVQFGSTPAKPNDFSPLKDLHSSSPPPVAGPEPTISARRTSLRELGSPLKGRSAGFHLGGGGSGGGGGAPPRQQMQPPIGVGLGIGNDGGDQEEDGGLGDFAGIDLTRWVCYFILF